MQSTKKIRYDFLLEAFCTLNWRNKNEAFVVYNDWFILKYKGL